MPPVIGAIGAAAGAFIGAPLAGTGLLATTALTTGLSATAWSAFQQIALGVALSALSRALMPAEVPQTRGTKLQITTGEAQPQSFLMGRFVTSGDLIYHGSYGKVNDTPRAYYTQVIQLADWPARLKRVWVDGVWQKYVPQSDGGDEGDTFPAFRMNGKENLWIRVYDGTQTAADPFLLDRFGEDEDHPWTDDMVGLGVPYVVVTSLFHPKVFPNGRPQMRFEAEAYGWYDRRKDSTAGGSGSQRWGNWRTWRPTNNPVVMIDNILRGVRDPITEEHVWGGQDIGDHDLPAADWFAAMNECDQAIDLADGGTEKQFRAGMEVRVDEEPAAVIEELLRSCAGQIADMGGTWTVRAGPPGVPVYAFTDDDIIVTSPETCDPFPGLDEAYNEVTATYPEPEHGYDPKDAPSRVDAEALRADGKRNIADLQFLATPYRRQVQRLMRSGLKEARRFRRHAPIVLPPEAQLLSPLDEVTWTSERYGYDAKRWAVDLVEDQSNGCVALSLRERDPTDYDWNIDFELPDEIGVLVKPQRPENVPDFSVFPANHRDAAGTARLPAILLAWKIRPGVTAIRYRVRLASNHAEVPVDLQAAAPETTEASGTLTIGGSPVTVNAVPLTYSVWTNPETGQVKIHGGALRPATAYEVQAAYVPALDWSNWLPVTTPNTKIKEDDLDDSVRQKVDDAATAADDAAEQAENAYKQALKSKDAIILGADGASIRLASQPGAILLLADYVIAPGSLSAGTFTVQSFHYNLVPDDQLQSDRSWHAWIPSQDAEWAVVPESSRDDVDSLGEIRWNREARSGSGSFAAMESTVFPVRPGMRLKVKGQVRRQSGSKMRVSVRLYFYARRKDGDGNLVDVVASPGAPSPFIVPLDNTFTALQQMAGNTVVPVGAYRAKLRFHVDRDNTNGDVRFFGPFVYENTDASVLITPDGVFAEALTAHEAFIESLEVTDANITRLNVKRLRMQEFTWSKPRWFNDATVPSSASDSWETIASQSINRRAGSDLRIDGAFGWADAGSVSNRIKVRFRRGGTVLQEFGEERPARDGGSATHIWFDESAQTGSTTYDMQVWVPAGYPAPFHYEDVVLFLTEIPEEETGSANVDLST